MVSNTKLNITKACREALRIMQGLRDGVHSVEHVVSVYRWCRKLTQFYPETDLKVLKISTYWHDVGRTRESKDRDDHNEKSTEMVEEYLLKHKADKTFINKVKDAVLNHSFNLKPDTIEGKILHDADKLIWIGDYELADVFEAMKEGFETEGTNRKNTLKFLNMAIERKNSSTVFYEKLILPESKEIFKKREKNFIQIINKLNKQT